MSRLRETQAERALEAWREFFGTPASGNPAAARGGPGEAALEADVPSEPQQRARADRKVLQLFQSVARDVPAYRSFLAAHGVDAAQVRDLESFRRLPPTSKDAYYREHPLPALCRHGALDACDAVALSSGSTGEPAAWPRFVSDELATTERFEQVLRDGFGAHERSTLAVICFALGNWVGGVYTLSCCRHLAAKGYPLTVASPGNQPAEILRAVRALGGHYEQRVLFGYPPFLKDVIDRGRAEGLDWSTPPTRLVMAGEVFSESWRDWMCRQLGGASPETATASLYGTADGGVLANETPLSIRIRRALSRRPDAARALFGEARLPTLCQYDPEHRYFEVETGGWLLFSGDGGVPLVRYRILDRGGVVSHAEMLQFLAAHGVELEFGGDASRPELPFVWVFGRSHFAVSFYGANVYPENVSVGIERQEFGSRVTGKFVLEVAHDDAQNAELRLAVELSRDVEADAELARRLAESVRAELERQNSEFAAYVPSERRTPRLQLCAFGDPEYFPTGVKHRYTR